LRAFGTSKNISKTIGTEILLYASAQRQIVDAVKRIGVKPGSSNVAAVAISLREDVTHQTMTAIMKELAGEMDDGVLGINTPDKTRTIKSVFGITEKELDSARMGTGPKDVEWAITRRVLSRISIMAISK
jgi:tRNA threonylcarbamoyladenosine modification (KEOPS) complex Cgi121 subunit